MMFSALYIKSYNKQFRKFSLRNFLCDISRSMSTMKGVLLITFLAISCAVAQDASSVEARSMDCYESCKGFAEYLKSRNVDDPIDEARKYCSSAKIKCDDVIRLAKLANVFVRAGQPMKRVCKSKKFCPEPKLVDNGIICYGCNFIVKTVSHLLETTNATVEEITEAVKELCKIFSPLKIQSKICADVTDYVRKIIQLILKKMDPRDVCVQLGFCNSTLSGPQSEALKQIKEVLPFVSRKIMEARKDLPYVMNRFKNWEKKHPNIKGANSCKMCKIITSTVFSLVKFSNASLQTMEKAIKAVCNTRPEYQKEMCLSYVERIDEIVQYIERKLTPGDVCIQLGVCSHTMESRHKSLKMHPRRFHRKMKSICRACGKYEDIIKGKLKVYEASSQSLRNLVAENCGDSASPIMQEKCMMIAPVLITVDGMVNSLLDAKICSKTLCNKGLLREKSKSSECDICKYGLDAYLKNLELSRQAVKRHFSKADSFCSNAMFKELSSQCKIFVNRTETLIEDITKDVNPDKVCKGMKLCKQESRLSFVNFWQSMSSDLSICGICKATFKVAQRKGNLEAVHESLRNACKNMKRFAKEKACQRIIDQSGDAVDITLKGKSSEDACQHLQLCGKPRGFDNIFGGIMKGFQDIFG